MAKKQKQTKTAYQGDPGDEHVEKTVVVETTEPIVR